MNKSKSSAAARPTSRTEPQREREPEQQQRERELEQLQLLQVLKSLPRKQRHGGETPWMKWPATAPSMDPPWMLGIKHRQPREIE